MEVTVQKWGKDLGVKIPALIVREFGLKNGTVVEMKGTRNEITIKLIKKPSLSEMFDDLNRRKLQQQESTDEDEDEDTTEEEPD